MKKITFLSLLAFLLAFSACQNPGFIAYRQSGTVYTSTIDSVPPGKAVNEKSVHTYGGWEPHGMSLSPDGKYLAVAQRKVRNNPRPADPYYNTEIRIYHVLQNKLLKTYTEVDLLKKIDNNSKAFDKGFAFFLIGIDWLDNKTLYVNGQPDNPRVESVPDNAAFGMDAMSGQLKGNAEFYSRSGQPNLKPPVHASKTKFRLSLTNGQVQIEGQNVNGLRTGVEAVDVVFIGN